MAPLAARVGVARADDGTRMSAPRVSVLIAAFNAAAFIEATLESALGQTFGDFEVLVIDDGSRDDTADVVRRVAASDPRLRLIVQENRGLSGTRNRGIAEAHGSLIAFLDHDDLWHPEKLALQVALLDARPRTAVVSCHSALIDTEHRCLGWRFGGDANGDVYAEMLVWDIVSGGSVTLVRRDALEAVGPFDETLLIREDWDMWIRLARRYEFATVPRVLVGYTRSAASSSRDYERLAEEGVRVLDKARRDDPGFDDARYRFCLARDLFATASFCAVDGHTALAWRYVGRSLALTPAPVVRSPRRVALVGVLGLRTILPRGAFQRVFAWLNRLSFQLEPGRPFRELDTRSA
jgi:glycosyltransferase involved in cell wall biosynthesis